MKTKYSTYHLWSVIEDRFGSVIASFDTEQEALQYIENNK